MVGLPTRAAAIAAIGVLGALPAVATAQGLERSRAIASSDVLSSISLFNYQERRKSELIFRATPVVSTGEGTAEIRYESGNAEISAEVKRLPPPALLGPYTTYVLWALTPDGRASNEGVLTGPDGAGKTRKVGLVQIPRNFSQHTGQELRDKLAEFERQGVEGVVLDLRGNPGGLLNAAVDVADAFLSSGTIVATVGVASPRKESHADDRYDFPELPVVVLIDQGSASASDAASVSNPPLDASVQNASSASCESLLRNASRLSLGYVFASRRSASSRRAIRR